VAVASSQSVHFLGFLGFNAWRGPLRDFSSDPFEARIAPASLSSSHFRAELHAILRGAAGLECLHCCPCGLDLVRRETLKSMQASAVQIASESSDQAPPRSHEITRRTKLIRMAVCADCNLQGTVEAHPPSQQCLPAMSRVALIWLCSIVQ